MFGSPRKGGNTEILLEEFLRGCESSGSEVERIHMSGLKLTGCLDCKGCEKTGVCVAEDGMKPVYQALDRCDCVVLASPIYFYNVTAQAKLVIDRSQALWSRKYLAKEKAPDEKGDPGRKGFFIAVGATRGKRMFEGVRLTVRYFFDAIDVEYAGELFYWGVDEKGAIRSHEKAMKECYDAGLHFVQS